jgi:hypothetical protein
MLEWWRDSARMPCGAEELVLVEHVAQDASAVLLAEHGQHASVADAPHA